MKGIGVERQTYTAKEISAYLGISKVGAYNLMQGKDFPLLKIGGRVLVKKADFEEWLKQQQKRA